MNETIIRKYRFFFAWKDWSGAGTLTLKGRCPAKCRRVRAGAAEQVRRLEIMTRNGQAIRAQL